MTNTQMSSAFNSAIKRATSVFLKKYNKLLPNGNYISLGREGITKYDFSLHVNRIKRVHGEYNALTGNYELSYFNCNECGSVMSNYIVIVAIFLTEELIKRIKRE